jgi:hypothetical protein
MPTTGTWVGAILMGCGFSAFVSLLAIRPTFVRAAAWTKALFLLMFALITIPMVLVFAFGLQAFRPPLLYAGVVAYAGFWIVAGYLQRVGIIGRRTKSTSHAKEVA